MLLSQFKNGEYNVLIATDVAARGVDIQDLQAVVNYNFPFNAKMFLHRGGRCARNGQYGIYVNLIDQTEMPYLLDSNLYCGGKLRIHNLDDYLFFTEQFPSKQLLEKLIDCPDGDFYQ